MIPRGVRRKLRLGMGGRVSRRNGTKSRKQRDLAKRERKPVRLSPRQVLRQRIKEWEKKKMENEPENGLTKMASATESMKRFAPFLRLVRPAPW